MGDEMLEPCEKYGKRSDDVAIEPKWLCGASFETEFLELLGDLVWGALGQGERGIEPHHEPTSAAHVLSKRVKRTAEKMHKDRPATGSPPRR